MSAIDLTDRYFTDEWMQGGRSAWLIDRSEVPFANYIVHHAGYDTRLTESSSRANEEIVIDAIARNHRARLGIGPGYYELIAPSGRRYAVGKAGTRRRHTSNHNPATGRAWNWNSYGACFLQNAEDVIPGPDALEAFEASIADVRSWEHLTRPNLRVMGHRDSGFATACPGEHLMPHVRAWDRPKGNADKARAHLVAAQREIDLALKEWPL